MRRRVGTGSCDMESPDGRVTIRAMTRWWDLCS